MVEGVNFISHGVYKESCYIAHVLDPSWKEQPQAKRAGCRILDFPTETASNSIRANSGSFMCISTTTSTQLRSAGQSVRRIRTVGRTRTGQKKLYIPVHFANIGQYQPSHLHFRVQQLFQPWPTVLSLHIHPKVSRINPREKKSLFSCSSLHRL